MHKNILIDEGNVTGQALIEENFSVRYTLHARTDKAHDLGTLTDLCEADLRDLKVIIEELLQHANKRDW